MQPVSEKDLKELIKQSKEAGKDVSKLEKTLETAREQFPPVGQTKEKQTETGTVVIESTGPAKEEDFEDYD